MSKKINSAQTRISKLAFNLGKAHHNRKATGKLLHELVEASLNFKFDQYNAEMVIWFAASKLDYDVFDIFAKYDLSDEFPVHQIAFVCSMYSEIECECGSWYVKEVRGHIIRLAVKYFNKLNAGVKAYHECENVRAVEDAA